ncbi:MAG: hypothetical protein KF841_14930 [Phycisphaerae bacterium]|nr:hypothetical protein [Phycisphaerae bacterium]
MPTYTCRACRQKFDAPDDPEAACIFCGVGLTEFRTRLDFHAGRYDLVYVAGGLRWIIRIAPFALLGQAALLLFPSIWLADWRIGVVELLPTFALAVVMGVQSFNLGKLLDRCITISLAMFVPLVNILFIVESVSVARTILHRAGLAVGALGVSGELARAAMDPTRCISCGYILTGLKRRRCPECGSEFDTR